MTLAKTILGYPSPFSQDPLRQDIDDKSLSGASMRLTTSTSSQPILSINNDLLQQSPLAGTASNRSQEAVIEGPQVDGDNLNFPPQLPTRRTRYVGLEVTLDDDKCASAHVQTSSTSLSPKIGTPTAGECIGARKERDAGPTVAVAALAKARPVAWRDLPNKKQLAILTLARLSEPLTQTSLRAYIFYQVKSFDPTLSDSTIASQVGILESSFAATQLVTAIAWGRAADSDRCGRKNVLLIGLFGTCLSCVGFGFSKSFWQAIMFRAMGGALNGNVGVMRTMISEIIKEKKYIVTTFGTPKLSLSKVPISCVPTTPDVL